MLTSTCSYHIKLDISLKITLILAILSLPIYAQNDSIRTERIAPVILKVSRIEATKLSVPLSISKLEFSERPYQQQLSFAEYLTEVPGLFTMNSQNFSQDLRISIRGFGARSAFGIRGIKLLVDGIPETTPDGQGQIDNLNLSIIESIEVIKGPAATLYGNASGGVISISTFADFDKSFFEARSTYGSYNLNNYQFTSGISTDATNYHIHGNLLKTDGFRRQSGFENYNFNVNVSHRFSNKSSIKFIANYMNSPFAQDAGGLTKVELEQDRRQARQRNVDFKTEETIDQFKTGVHFDQQWNSTNLKGYAFYSHRNFRGLLPFEFGGIVQLDRDYYGTGLSLTHQHFFKENSNKLQVGYDLGFQSDRRSRYQNLLGNQGSQTLDQQEIFRSVGLSVLDHLQLGKLLIKAGLRLDINLLKARDYFLSNGDDSGSINLNALNPSLGISYALGKSARIFAGVASNFETPTLSELSSNPSDLGGFNQNLEAQRSVNYEIGYKLNTKKTALDLSLFYIQTSDDLVPFELEEFPDRTFFRNAGSTRRSGLELFMYQELLPNLGVSASYTYAHYRYNRFETPTTNFNGKYLPGIPKHLGALSIQYKKADQLFVRFENRIVGALYADDTNTTADSAYLLTNLTLGTSFNIKGIDMAPYLIINNLFDTTYNDNIRINAFGSRYFEPGPGITMTGGIKFNF